MSRGSANNVSYFACISMLQVNISFHVLVYEPKNSKGSYQYLLFFSKKSTLCLCMTIGISVCFLDHWYFQVQLYCLPLGPQCVVLLFLNLSDPPPPFPSPFSPIAPMELGKITKLWQSGLVTCICLELVCYLALIRWQSNDVVNYSNWLLREDRDSKSWCLWSPNTCNYLRKEWHLIL